ncbi:hypothetical protein P7C71_g5707, partial [Lecanoromycetidae sp. Uapishka_2]
MTTEMASHDPLTSDQVQMSTVSSVDSGSLGEFPMDALAEGFDWGSFDFDSIDFSSVNMSSLPELDEPMVNSDIQSREDYMKGEPSAQPKSESPQRPTSSASMYQSKEANVPSDPMTTSTSLDELLIADGLPRDTFDTFKSPEQDLVGRQPHIPAMTRTYPFSQKYAPGGHQMLSTRQPSQHQYVGANSQSLEDASIPPRIPIQPTPQRNQALKITEMLNPPSFNDNPRTRSTINVETFIPNSDNDHSSPDIEVDYSDEEEDEVADARHVGRNRKSSRSIQSDSFGTKGQKQEVKLRTQPVKAAPRPLVKSNPRFVPNEDYTHVNYPCEDWDDFKYTKHGELKPSKLYSGKQISHYLWDHPLHQGAADKTSSELVLRVHRNPSRSATRFPTTLSHRCRFKDCPIGTINQGQISVSFCEIDKSYPRHDPFLEAGWVHLYCLERFTNFPRVCAELNVVVDTRKLKKEINGKNLFRFGTSAEEKLVEKFIKACRADKLPESYPEQTEGEEYEYEGTLCHRLALTKVSKEPGNYSIQRSVREELAGYKGSNIESHMGDLVVEAALRKKTRLHQNQNSNLENPMPSRKYRRKRQGQNSESDTDCTSESEDGGADKDAEMQEKWLQEAEKRPLRRKAPIANMGQSQSLPSPKAQQSSSRVRAPTRDDRIAEEWMQRRKKCLLIKHQRRTYNFHPNLLGSIQHIIHRYRIQHLRDNLHHTSNNSVHKCRLTPPSSPRKQTSDEAGNDSAPQRRGLDPELRQSPSNSESRTSPRVGRKRARDEIRDETNDEVEEPWQKRARRRLAPSPPRQRITRKKGRASNQYTSKANKELDEILHAQAIAEWEKMYSPEYTAVRKEMAEARKKGDIGDDDLVVLTNYEDDEPSPEERREALKRAVEENRRKREVEREFAAFLEADGEEEVEV